MKITSECEVVDVETEDSGMAKIFQIDTSDENLFFRVQSWDDMKVHDTFNAFVGKKVRITLEVIE